MLCFFVGSQYFFIFPGSADHENAGVLGVFDGAIGDTAFFLTVIFRLVVDDC